MTWKDAAFGNPMTDQPSTQGCPHERIATVGYRCVKEAGHPGQHSYTATTQEAEKAFAALQYFLDLDNPYLGASQARVREGIAALRSLRTQHTADQERIDELEEHAEIWRARANDLEHRRTKDREEIAQLTDRIEALQLQHTIDLDEIRALRRGRDGEGSPRNRAVR